MTPIWFHGAVLITSVMSITMAAAAFVRAGRRMAKGDALNLEARLVELETKVAALPTHKAVHELAISIEHLAGEVKALNARQDGMVKIVERLETITERQERHLLTRVAN